MMRSFVTVSLLSLTCALRAVEFPQALQTSSAIHNVFQVSTNVFSGSEPEGKAGFAALQVLGITTILSVDGAIPDVELARQHGMRYIHLPIGYDGIPTNRALELAKVAESIEGPIYVHCHHGEHRGPAAAATLCLAEGVWTTAQATAWLHEAGTSTNYLGLYQSVSAFQKPGADMLASGQIKLPEITRPSGVVAAMVAIDKYYDHLKDCHEAGWQTPPDQPDVTPAREALMLLEQFRELQRIDFDLPQDKDFQNRLAKTTEMAKRLYDQLDTVTGTAPTSQLDGLFQQVTQDCTACHQAHRD